MTTMQKLTLDDVLEISSLALRGAGATAKNAESVARSTVLAERDGIRSHGLMYVPIYAEHVICGKVDGVAEPLVDCPKPGVVRVDAKNGFAHPAIDAGWNDLARAAQENGVGVMTVHNSYNCGVLGHHAKTASRTRLARFVFHACPGINCTHWF